MTTKAARGQTIRTDYARDDSSHTAIKNNFAPKMGGSVTNLAHSLSGASPNQEGEEKKNRFS
jgi:hypothetical protein